MENIYGNWKIGDHPSYVVSDIKVKNTNFPSPPNPAESNDEDVKLYGGYLVCESVGNIGHAKLISAAPLLFEMLVKIRRDLLKRGVTYDNVEIYNEVDKLIKLINPL